MTAVQLQPPACLRTTNICYCIPFGQHFTQRFRAQHVSQRRLSEKSRTELSVVHICYGNHLKQNYWTTKHEQLFVNVEKCECKQV